MDISNSAAIAANLPLYLSLEQMADPRKVIDEFFQCLTLNDARELITSVFDSAICLPDDCLEDVSRSDLQFSKTEVLRFFEAVFMLYKATPRSDQ